MLLAPYLRAAFPLWIALGSCQDGDRARLVHTQHGATSSRDIRPAITATPALDVPGRTLEGTERFQYPAAATRLPNGTIVVADPRAARIRFVDSVGRLLRTVDEGQKGMPFKSPSWLSRCHGDSIFVWDRTRYLMSVFDTTGHFVRSYSIRGHPVVLACSHSGTFAALLTPTGLQRSLSRQRSRSLRAPIVVLDHLGDSTASLGILPAGEAYPLGRITRLAVGPRVYVGTGENAAIEWFSLNGRQRGSFSAGTISRKVTRRHHERAADAQVALLSNDTERAAAKRSLMRFPLPQALPPYSALLTSPTGVLWVVVSTPGDTVTALRGFDRDGRRLGDLTLPRDIRVLEIGDTHLLGAYEGDHGTHHLVSYAYRLHGQ